MTPTIQSLDLDALRNGLREDRFTPTDIVEEVYRRISARGEEHIWITLISLEESRKRAHAVEEEWRRFGHDPERFPLYGVPFAVKDNIDLAGVPTTAACPEFAYAPAFSAPSVERLLNAGAMCIGKTNMDQFATGLNGTRSPYGTAVNPAAPGMIPGGSSSGSAAAVSAGLVTFALGTDTAGSGRVPAACTNIVGLKPSRGIVSARGSVAACRSLDCISVLALGCEEALEILRIMSGFDPLDPYSRETPAGWDDCRSGHGFRFGIPNDRYLDFRGDSTYAALFEDSVSRLEELGGRCVTIDFATFRRAAEILYEGPWVAERLTAVGAFLASNPHSLHPVTREILEKARGYNARQVFDACHELELLRRHAWAVLRELDCLAVPSIPRIYSVAELLEDPLEPNAILGMYTNFVNLLDLCAVAVPAGFRPDGVPFGITLIGPAFSEGRLVSIGGAFHRRLGTRAGATPWATPGEPVSLGVRIAVAGAHLTGQPLNHQLVELGGKLWRKCRTAPVYRLYALENRPPLRPGLVRQADGRGTAVEVEVWELPPAGAGNFLSRVLPPLVIGTVELEDGRAVKGFLCEDYAIHGAKDISAFGGWRTWLAVRVAPGTKVREEP